MKNDFKILMTNLGALAIFTFMGCQSQNDQSTSTESSTETVQSTDTDSKTNESKTDTVYISQMQFQPANLTINKGDTVIWINKDIVSHNVTEDPLGSVKSDTLKTGDSFKIAPDHSFHYICSIHPTMKAEINVNE